MAFDQGHSESSSSGGGIVLKTHAELYAMRIGAELVPGTFYVITDFTTIYDQPDYDNAGAPKVSVTTKTAAQETLIVFATSNQTLHGKAYSPSFSKDSIMYDIMFIETEVMASPAKGRIIERIDDKGNRTDYDHRKVLLKRYETIDTSGVFNSYKDTGFASNEFLTFNSDLAFNNYISDNIPFKVGQTPFVISNNTFTATGNTIVTNNKFLGVTQNNTFLGAAKYNNQQGAFHGNIIGDTFEYNEINTDFLLNTIGTGFTQNSIIVGEDFSGNSVPDNFNRNCLIGRVASCTFNSGFTHNLIKCSVAGVDFSGATHVYQSYSCDLFEDSGFNLKLSYIDNLGVLTVVAQTA